MTTYTLLLLVFSVILAGVLSYFQYLYKAKSHSKIDWFLAFLRFLSLLGVMVLLINPIISKKEFTIEKPPLPIVLDNSSSIPFLGAKQQALLLYKKILSNAELKEKYDVNPFLFDENLTQSDSIRFNGKKSQLNVVAKELKNLYRNTFFPTIILSDGNQTSGDDYVNVFDVNNKVFPVVLGDTTSVFDLKISRVNANKYAFLKNRFPVEVFVQYSGNSSIASDFTIYEGNKKLVQQNIRFTPNQKSLQFTVLLPAEKVGLHLYKAIIHTALKEKNKVNNVANFAVEVLDQKTTIGIVSSINHPDLGAFKRAVESNAQRKVVVLNPQETSRIKECQVVIFYQPNRTYQMAFETAKQMGINSFFVTGLSTDFTFVNQQQSYIEFQMTNQKEDYLPSFNANFNQFAQEDIGFDKFPPLSHPFGKMVTNENVKVLLESKIRSIATGFPLMAFVEDGNRRLAFLLGENSWKWRLQSYQDQKSFEKYDIFIDKSIQFLASKRNSKALEVEFENFYNAGEPITINAQFFNKNYEFDDNAQLSIVVTNTKSNQTKQYDLLKAENSYQVNLDGLNAGSYSFVVKEQETNTRFTGRFEILDFDIEKQFVVPDYRKLSQLASQTQGAVYLPKDVNVLIQNLVNDNSYQAIEKEKKTQSPLIDWVWLLVAILVFLVAEWVVRKYHGKL